jgi:glycine hydroxymethyltransferase
MSAADHLARTDPELWDANNHENRRHEDHLELIASENNVRPAGLAADPKISFSAE